MLPDCLGFGNSDGRTDKRTGGQADKRTGGQADKRTGGRADKRTGGRVDGRTSGQADKRTRETETVDKEGFVFIIVWYLVFFVVHLSFIAVLIFNL
jgi:hypothetical protein